MWGHSVREKEREREEALGLGCAEGLWELASVPLMRGKEGEGESWAGPAERKKRGGEMGRGERAGPRGLGCFLFLFFSFSFPHSNYLNTTI
jgi:hypothetical protein